MRAPALLIAALTAVAAEPPAGMVTLPGGKVGPTQIGAFSIGRAEVTQAEYRRLMGVNPAHHKGDDRPVENVSWHDAVRYLNTRSRSENLTPCYDAAGARHLTCTGYRLPTDAEWRFAAGDDRAGARLRDTGHTDPAALESAPGTAPAGASNRNGISDLYGNVWEWVEDWYNQEPIIDSVYDPQGPQSGIEKTIRGGSYLTNRTNWNKSFVSSMAPARRSPYTGFRVARTVSPAGRALPPDPAWLAQFQKAPTGSAPLPIPAEPARAVWEQFLGLPGKPFRQAVPRVIRQYRELDWNGQLADFDFEPGYPSRVLIAEPVRKPTGRLPVVIVPFYDVDSPIGRNLGGRRWGGGGPRAFAQQAVQRGMLAVSIRWFAEGDGESYDESVHLLTRRHPGLTPMAKWVQDARSLVDYLITRPDVDPKRIGMIGHSLGGKMTLYAAALDPRIAVSVASEPGIGFSFSNYDAFWYLGPRLKTFAASHDQHELLALMAGRPFLLIAGDSADGDKSWPFILAAQPAYAKAGNRTHIGLFNHRSGHTPSDESVVHAIDWLERFLRRN